MAQQGLGRQHQHGVVAYQGHELRRHRQLQGLAQPHLIGQHEASAMRPAVGVKGELDEMLLMLPKPNFAAIDGRLHHRRCRVRLIPPSVQIAHQFAPGQAVQVLNDEIRQRHREGRGPQGIELGLHPSHRLRRIVFPHQFIIEAEGGLGFVGATQKGGPAAVRQGNDAGLAMNKAKRRIGQDANLHLAGTQKLIKALEARPGRLAKRLGPEAAPFAPHGGLGGLGRFHISSCEIRVANHANLALNGLQRLPSDF